MIPCHGWQPGACCRLVCPLRYRPGATLDAPGIQTARSGFAERPPPGGGRGKKPMGFSGTRLADPRPLREGHSWKLCAHPRSRVQRACCVGWVRAGWPSCRDSRVDGRVSPQGKSRPKLAVPLRQLTSAVNSRPAFIHTLVIAGAEISNRTPSWFTTGAGSEKPISLPTAAAAHGN